jgi:NAD(P)-dependent dehydrogenase (short-subunit alcohol dehydrogenase family)
MPKQNILLITGASRGIGSETAIRAARSGYHVAVNYLQEEEAAQHIVKKIILEGGDALAIQADVADESAVQNMFDTLDRELGPVNALVNNAGILDLQTQFEDISAERFHRILSTNVIGSFLCAREAVKRMAYRHGGHGGAIVNVSSMAARLGSPNEYIDYAASKGAVETMTIGLAKEVADEGIRVNAVRPGIIDTEMHASGGEPERVERLSASIPMQRGGRADEVAEAILWLLSEKASYTTGSFIDVAGGR